MSEARPLPGGGWFTLAEGQVHPAQLPPRAPTEAAASFAESITSAIRRHSTGIGSLHLSLGGIALAIPAAMAERILPMTPMRPFPGAPHGVLGLAQADGAPVLVLDTAFASGMPEDGGEAPVLLLVLHREGRRFGLPAARVEAGPAIPAMAGFTAWLESPEARQALTCAPPAREDSVPPAVAERHLMLFRAAGLEASLPAETVVAVLPPTSPLPTSRPGLAGLAAHRGAVLPVLDAGLVLGGAAALRRGPAPMIRLALQPEVLVAVEQVTGVRRIPAADVTPLAQREGLVAAVARVGDMPLPVLSAGRLGAH
ncbi:chemotaxis protein CheW [Roseococcus sp. YIM B11640]|uniref:chemotaxis protein CheW n=1 Tax=Roseococcus sp. YIM B11640 TaxID=3133973 RepID=UPI003C7DAB16